MQHSKVINKLTVGVKFDYNSDNIKDPQKVD